MWSWVCSCTFRIEMLAIRAFNVGDMDVVPLSAGFPNAAAVYNSISRFAHTNAYLADSCTAFAGFILAAIVATYGLILLSVAGAAVTGKPASWQRLTPFAGAVLGLYLLAAAACLADQQAGYRIDNTLAATISPTTRQINNIIDPLQLTIQANPESADAAL